MNNELRQKAVNAFNKVWTLIDKEDITKEEKEQMINLANLSKELWIKAGGTNLNIARSDWMISHVYSILGNGRKALVSAENCLRVTLKNNLDDFDLVFAYEAMAYAYKVLGDKKKLHIHLTIAYSHIDQVKEKEDREYCTSQLDLLL